MNEIFIIAIILQTLLLSVIGIATENKKISIAAIVALLLLIGISVTSEEYGIAKTDLPREDLPFFVKANRMEGEEDVYMEIVPYNDINATEQQYYKTKSEKFQQLANITVGMTIINDGGTIKPFSVNPKV